MFTRRDTLASLLLTGAAAALPMPAVGATTLRKPPRLKAGDVVGLVEPASAVDEPYDLRFFKETIEAMGLVPKVGKHVGERIGYLAGEDAARAADLNAMYADKDVRAVFAVRGGWGSARMFPYLDWRTIRANPKLLVGYSDVTALHMAFAKMAGFTTIHGPNASNAWGKRSWEPFRALVFDGATPTYTNPVETEDRLAQREWRTRPIRGGKARGRLLGGNLTVLTSLLGSAYLPDFTGAILFIEDVGESQYRIDRMLTSLSLADVLRKVKGVVFGQCTGCQTTGQSFGNFTVSQVLEQHLAPLGVPVFEGSFFGHIRDQFSLPENASVEIDADAGSIRVLEPVVS